MSAATLAERLALRGISMAARQGRLLVWPSSRLTDEDRAAIRQHRNELLALLAQGPESNSDPIGASQAANEKSPGAADAWQAADRAYRRHVEACAICAAAGRGYGQRCPAGADLWARYARLPGPAAPRQQTTGHDAITLGPHPYQAERLRDWSPASEEEVGRMAAVQARALALGMHEAEAERLADVVHWGRRCGDERAPCVTCAHLRAGSDSRWRCAVQHLALPVELVALPHRCPHRLEALP